MSSIKMLAWAGVAVLVVGQSVWAGAPGLQLPRGRGSGTLSTGPLSGGGGGVVAQPAQPMAGSPTIYYSSRPNVLPSLTPPSMNLTPSIGYSSGFNVTGMNNFSTGYTGGFTTTSAGFSAAAPMSTMSLGYSGGFATTGTGFSAAAPISTMSLGYSGGFNTIGSGASVTGLGYQTGIAVTGMSNFAATPGAATLGNRTFSPLVNAYGGPAYTAGAPTTGVNQNFYQSPGSDDYTTSILPQQTVAPVSRQAPLPLPRLMNGVLNN